MRRPISSKSNTCTESVGVYAAGISVKVSAHYPGRSVHLRKLLCSEGYGKNEQKSAEGIVRVFFSGDEKKKS
jgi:hypothetical protein